MQPGTAQSRTAPSAGTPASSALTLDQRRVFIFPAWAGIGFAAVLLVLLIGAINYDNGLTYALTFLLGGAALVSILHTWRNLHGLRCHEAHCAPVFAGEHAAFRITLENPSALTRHALAVTALGPRSRGRAPVRSTTVWTDLNAGARQEITLELPAPRRGRLVLGRVRLATWFPFGWMRAWAHWDTHAETLVYPRPLGTLPLPSGAETGADEAAGSRAGSEDFMGFRAYRPGDPARAIAWKAFARGQALQVKRFTGGAHGTLWLEFDATRGLGDLEARLSQLCAWTLAASRAGIRFGLRLPARELEPDLGAAHCARCLRALALYGVLP